MNTWVRPYISLGFRFWGLGFGLFYFGRTRGFAPTYPTPNTQHLSPKP
ncbi:MAG: hypothetical protein Q4A56_08450 [Porphyromonadaceae bacterium]|nr:hypothetical protein [Porphyromonadaceae bacterium]